MIRIFKDKHDTANYVVQSTCVDPESFLLEFAEALSVVSKDLDDYALFSILKVAMPILFKLSGYKAEEVREQRTLLCGSVTPESCDVIATSGC
jgi:hypothetical protein